MDSIHAFLLGVVQAVTEFLPISSSGHLLVAHDVLGFDQADSLRFDAALHLGTLLALLVYFWRDVRSILRGFFRSLRHWQVRQDTEQGIAWAVIIGAIPAGIVGFLAEDWISNSTRNIWIVIVTLVVGALAFWWVEHWSKRQVLVPTVTLPTALVVGLAQVVALIPGISRSGATIVAGFARKLDRATAARFAFLVSLPVVAGAGILKLGELISGSPSAAELREVIIGIITAAGLGYLVIRFFLRFVQSHSLGAFAWYRVGLAIVLAVYMLVR